MLSRLGKLRADANETAQWRGHYLNWHPATVNYSAARTTQYGECKCGGWVVINTNPLPNDISVGGTAIALDCEDV